MRLVNVRHDGSPYPGIVTANGSISSIAQWGYPSIVDLLEAGPTAWSELEVNAVSSSGDWPPDVPLYAPILRPPRNMFCVGLNYVTHYEEGDRQGAKMPEYPVFFTKPSTLLIGPNDDLVIDRSATEKADWEAELAVVIGVGGVNINEDDALEHVFGYCLANDVSARDLQLANGPLLAAMGQGQRPRRLLPARALYGAGAGPSATLTVCTCS